MTAAFFAGPGRSADGGCWIYTRVDVSTLASTPNNCLVDDPAVDYLLPGYLGGRQLTLSHGLLQKGVFSLRKQISHTIGVFDEIIVGVCRVIFRNPF